MSKSAEVESMQRKRYKLEDFAFDLPESLLAITPSMKRDACRLMKIDTEKETLQDGTFTDIVDELEAGDVLVLNDTKVSNIRMFAQRKNKGSTSTFEVLLLKSNIKSSDIERAMVRPQKRLHLGDELEFAEDLTAKVISIEKNEVTLHFSRVLDWEDLDKYGKLPMPLYIVNARKKRSLQTKGDEFDQIDKEYYQTVFSSQEGSHAAPTAGLHFTKELLEKLENKGVIICKIQLFVSLGTFQPLYVEYIDEVVLHKENYHIDPHVIQQIQEAKAHHHKVVAVGTTTLRALESYFSSSNEFFSEGEIRSTQLYISPGYQVKSVDALITNFHTSKSSLLILVSALMGYDLMKKAYHHAIKQEYRFFTYGDAMFIKNFKRDT